MMTFIIQFKPGIYLGPKPHQRVFSLSEARRYSRIGNAARMRNKLYSPLDPDISVEMLVHVTNEFGGSWLEISK